LALPRTLFALQLAEQKVRAMTSYGLNNAPSCDFITMV
jgi:hypothetical protein